MASSFLGTAISSVSKIIGTSSISLSRTLGKGTYCGGTATDTSSLIVSGIGFGTKAVAIPLLWADFSEGTTAPHSTLSRVTAWDYYSSPTSLLVYDSDDGFDGSSCIRSAVHVAGTPNSGTGWWEAGFDPVDEGVILNTLGAKVYIFRKIKKNFPVGLSPDYCDNWKDLRMYGDDQSETQNYFGWQSSPDNCSFNWGYYPSGKVPYYGNDTEATNYDWQTIELTYLVNSVLDNIDGRVRRYADNVLLFDSDVDYGGSSEPGFGWKSSTGNCSKDTHFVFPVHGIPANWDTIEADDNFWIDDIYLDNTWQRVIVGDAATYSTCTHLEIQIPTAWSDTSVTVVVNRGTFGATDTAYIYVFNTDGTPNTNGFPIKFGDSY